jgi:hypothetical protein
MALPTNTWTSFSAVGNREDLADIIYDISPTETPFVNQASKGKAKAVYHEWQTDALRAAASNRALEGDDATGATLAATTRVGNYCQISEQTVIVSGTQRSVDAAGRGDEYTFQTLKSGKELKRDMELALTQNQASSAGGAGTARSSASLESWLSTNKTSVGTGTAQTTPGFSSGTVAAPTDSTLAGTFTKAALDAVIQACWTAGGDPSTIMCGAHNRTIVSGFSGISTLQTDANANGNVTLMGAIDFYKSNFGTLKVVPNRFQRDQTVLVLDFEYLGISALREMNVTPLAKTGDSDKAQLIHEFTLNVKNEAASGKITDCTTS